MKSWHAGCFLAFLFSLGCGSPPGHGPMSREAADEPPNAPAFQVAKNGRIPEAKEDAEQKPGGGNAGGAPGQDVAKPLPRKIIYNAEVRLIVKDLSQAAQDLKQLIKDHDALIATSESGGSSGAPRQGSWRVRVPVERFDSFLDEVVKLGIPQKNKIDSQDVSEDYYDLLDRIKNKKMEQETFRGYLQKKEATSKLEDILAIEKELTRVRGELDQLEGKLRRLKDLTALATVVLTMQEIKDYVPPQAPTFGNRIGSTFSDSLEALAAFGRGLVLVIVALTPWLPVLAVVALPVWVAWRRFRRRSQSAHHMPTVEAVPDNPAQG
jgi:hypothetical protein